MDKEELYLNLFEILGDDKVFKDENLSKRSSFETGGLADIFITPASIAEVVDAVKLIKEAGVELTVVGNCTNLLIRDKGIRGVTMSLYDKFNVVNVEGTDVHAQSGALISGCI